MIDLEGKHRAALAYQLREDCSEVTRAGAYLDDVLARLQLTSCDTAGVEAWKPRRDATLSGEPHRDILIEDGRVADNWRPVLVEVPGARTDELVPRHFAERSEEMRIGQTRARHHRPCEDASEVG